MHDSEESNGTQTSKNGRPSPGDYVFIPGGQVAVMVESEGWIDDNYTGKPRRVKKSEVSWEIGVALFWVPSTRERRAISLARVSRTEKIA